jgi:hypothetical protein
VDDGKLITLYVNGVPVKSEAVGGPVWALGEGPLVLGAWLSYGKPTTCFTGRLGGVTYWNKALAPEEVKAEFAGGLR